MYIGIIISFDLGQARLIIGIEAVNGQQIALHSLATKGIYYKNMILLKIHSN